MPPPGPGANIVMHSVTKALAGHSDLLMGAVITTDTHSKEQILSRRVLLGAVPSAFDAYLATAPARHTVAV